MKLLIVLVIYCTYGLSLAAVAYSASNAFAPANKEAQKKSTVFWICGAVFMVIVGSSLIRQVVSWEPLIVSVAVAVLAAGFGLFKKSRAAKQ